VRTDTGDSDARVRVAGDLDSNLLVMAGAGTGKTTALVGRVVGLVRAGVPMGDIAAITFTEAAAAELRQQIRQAIEIAAAHGDERMVAADGEVDDATISTVHSLAHRILTDHCVEAGLPPRFEVLDDSTDAADFDVRWKRFADTLLEDPEAERALVLGFAAGLRHTDLAAVARALHGHWDRLEDGGLAHLTAAPNCSDTWPSTNPDPVIHSLARARSAIDWCTDDSDRMALHLRGTVTDAGARLAAAGPDTLAVFQLLEILPSFRCAQGRQENWGGHIAEVRAACAEAEQSRCDFLDQVRRAVLGQLVARLATFTLDSAEERRIEGRLTFHDLLVHARRLVRGGGQALHVLRHRYRRLLIDEFQDTDPIQMELATLLASIDGTAELERARPGALFLVGDPQQSIYRFRRAEAEIFDRVGVDIGGTLELQTNFRSVPGIVDFVNVVFREIFGDGPDPGQVAHHPLQAARSVPAPHEAADAKRPRPDESSPVQLSFAGFDDSGFSSSAAASSTPRRNSPTSPAPVVTVGGAIAAFHAEIRRRAARDAAAAVNQVVGQRWLVADTGRGERHPARFGDIAVLIPARSSLATLEVAFKEAGVPYRLEGAALLWGAEEVRDVLTVLRAADDPADSVSVIAALRSPGLACGDDDLVSWHAAGGAWDPRSTAPPGLEDHPVSVAMAVLDRLHGRRWWNEPSAMVAAAYDELGSFALALAHRRPRDHWHRLRWLQDQARLFDESPGGTMREFLAWAELRAAGDGRTGGVGPPDPDDDAVRVMTIHGAKGLEFPVVVLAGLERDRSDGPGQPAVVWSEHRTPEINAGLFRTAGYEQAGLRAQHLDVLEQQRLLYVAMTRARDHLVVCLHHRQRNGGPDASLAAVVTGICTGHPSLWRRLPDAGSLTGTPPRDDHGGPPSPGLVPLPAQWEVDRNRLLAALRKQPVTTATALSRMTSPPEDVTPAVTEWRRTDERRRVGRSVHQALAALDLSTGFDSSGRSADDVARTSARAHGVTNCASAVATMVDRALASPTVARAATRRRWHEVYVNTPVGHGGLLEGSVDLLVEEDDGLVVVEYKTETIPDPPSLATAAMSDWLQLAAYAVALESSTELPVARCVLVFIGAGGPFEHVLQGEDLVQAKTEAAQTAALVVA
jgi:ATP-dependent helicase/nuclease subunit A